MKKFISVILSVIIIFSAFSVTSFAEEYTPKTEEAVNSLDFEKGVSIEFTDFSTNESLIMHIKGNKFAGKFTLDGIKISLLIIDGAVYMYFTKFPFFYIKSEGSFEDFFPSDIITDTSSEVDFKGNYEKTVDDIIYNVEKFTDENGLLYEYYLIGNELKAVEVSDDTDLLSRIDIISTEVNDKEFRLPFFALNLTPIINFFFGKF